MKVVPYCTVLYHTLTYLYEAYLVSAKCETGDSVSRQNECGGRAGRAGADIGAKIRQGRLSASWRSRWPVA